MSIKALSSSMFLLGLLLIFNTNLNSQSIGIGTASPNSSAVLDLTSSEQGILMPRLTTAQRDAIQNPAAGLLIFNTSDNCFNYFDGIQWYKDCGRKLYSDAQPFIGLEGGSGNDEGVEIESDASGNIYVLGSFEGTATIGNVQLTSSGNDGFSLFVSKYDQNGNFQWVFKVDDANGIDMAIDDNNNILLTGNYSGTVSFGGINLTSPLLDRGALFVAKYDSNGNAIWAKTGGGAGQYNSTRGNSIASDASGNVIVTGYFAGAGNVFGSVTLDADDNNLELFSVKYDVNGNVQWAKKIFDSTYSAFTVGMGVDTDATGNIYLTGQFGGETDFGGTTLTGNVSDGFFLLKYNPNGDLQWVRQGSNFAVPTHVAVNASGEIFAFGSCSTPMTFGTETISNGNRYLVKYDANGNALWAISASTNQYSTFYSSDLEIDGSGNLYITGDFGGNADFSGNSLTSAGGLDVYIAKYSGSGAFIWAKRDGGSSDELGRGIALSGNNIFITGSINGSDCSLANQSLTTQGIDAFIIQYDGTGSPLNPNTDVLSTQDKDMQPDNELIISATLNGNILEITDAGGTTSVDLSPIAGSSAARQEKVSPLSKGLVSDESFLSIVKKQEVIILQQAEQIKEQQRKINKIEQALKSAGIKI